jgi:3-dehydroquinate dehydratase/shikimate dehydrogenase
MTSGTVDDVLADMASAAERGADMLELRLDYLAQPPSREAVGRLVSAAPLPVIATCRAVRQGGMFRGGEDERLALLAAAATAGAAYVDVEDDVPPDRWPDAKVILSHHDFAGRPADLARIAKRLDASPAAVNKIAFAAAGPEDALAALDVIGSCDKPTISLAMGEHGLASRVLARKLGAFATFASLAEGAGSAAGQLTLAEMRALYRWESVGPGSAVFGVIGCPIAHSMSPAVHNAAFAATGVDAVYLPLRVEPGSERFDAVIDAIVARPWLGVGGLSVTIPHKENALARVGLANCDELAASIGAANTVTFRGDGTLRGDNTDYSAATDALCDAMGISRQGLAGRRVAVIGAGGTSRAIVAALCLYGARVTVYNRTVSRGDELAREFGCTSAGLDALAATDAEIVVNSTSIGMHPRVDASPLDAIPPSVKVVFDAVYNPVRTRLLAMADAAGCVCVSGLEMFVNQAVAQFELWLGRPAPRGIMRDVIIGRLSK